MSTPLPIERREVQALLNRARLGMALRALQDQHVEQSPLFDVFQGRAKALAEVLASAGKRLADKDDELGGYAAQGVLQAALARLPDHCERLSFAEMKSLVRAQLIDGTSEVVTGSQVDAVVQLQNAVSASFEAHDKHSVAVVDVGDGAVLHSETPGTSTDILAEGGAA